MAIEIPAGTTRAAVVIGVDRTSGLQPLHGASTGALDMQLWLQADGYHVTAHRDTKDRAVRLADVFDTVSAYATCPTMEQLLIYFSGHGYYTAQSEIWLLSGAPNNASEAVNLGESAEFARMTRLKNVIFIADTCRSIPQDPRGHQVRGGSIFPNLQVGGECAVDIFFATLAGDPAAEVSVDEAMKDYKGVFTEILKEIHERAEPADLVGIPEDNPTMQVFPNRRLKKRLPEFFRKEVRARQIKIRQSPSLRIESDEPVYIVRAHLAPAPPAPPPEPDVIGGLKGRPVVRPTPYAMDRNHKSLEEAARGLVTLNAIPATPTIPDLGTEPKERQLAIEARAQMRVEQGLSEQGTHFETRSGALISGSNVIIALPIGPFGIDIEDSTHGRAKLRFKNRPDDFSPLGKPFSAAIRFADGSGTIIAALPGYVATLIVGDQGITSVSYTPAPGSPHWNEYEYGREEIENRRALAATSARHGVLALDREDAREFGDTIRVGKSIDPTLGLYAALAYAGVGLREDAKSVLAYMQDDLRASLFDPWLLAGADKALLSEHRPLAPLCPMMSQAWNFLGPAGVKLPPVLEDAARQPSLWTTFLPESMGAIIDAIVKGDLK